MNTTLPTPAEHTKRFTEFVAAQENHAKLLLRQVEFIEVVGAIDLAYQRLSGVGDGVTLGLATICIVCHQSFFGGAAAIFRGQPHDSAVPSRRAIEAARTALALLLDPENAKRWLAHKALDRCIEQGHSRDPLFAEAIEGIEVAAMLLRRKHPFQLPIRNSADRSG